MSINLLRLLIEKIRLEILVLQIQLQIKLFKEKLTVPNLPKPKHIIIHHSAGVWSFEQVNNSHKNKWGFRSSLGYYMGYHYWIDDNGDIIQTRSDNEQGAHTVEQGNPGYWNKNSVGICLRGDMTQRKPTYAQLDSLKKLVEELSKKYNIPKSEIFGHQEISPTLCPGCLMECIKSF